MRTSDTNLKMEINVMCSRRKRNREKRRRQEKEREQQTGSEGISSWGHPSLCSSDKEPLLQAQCKYKSVEGSGIEMMWSHLQLSEQGLQCLHWGRAECYRDLSRDLMPSCVGDMTAELSTALKWSNTEASMLPPYHLIH